MRLAVVLISEQTVPNVVWLEDTKSEWDKILFVSTSRMEGKDGKKKSKSRIILDAIGEPPHDVLIVNQEMIFDVGQKLKEYFDNNSFDRVIVNVTGGTKIMSLATYTFFQGKKDVEIWYLPIGSSVYKRIYPLGEDGRAVDRSVGFRLDVERYFKSIGVEIESIGEPLNIEIARRIMDKYFEKRRSVKRLTEILKEYRGRRKKRVKIKRSDDWVKVSEYMKEFKLNAEEFDFGEKDWASFFSGGWFEEFVYDEMQKLKDSGCIDDVRLNLKIKTKESEESEMSNELDVVFTKDNNLYVVECKSGDLSVSVMTNEVFYKTAYLNKTFGLSAKSFIAYLGRNGERDVEDSERDQLEKRAPVFGLEVIFADDIREKGIRAIFEDRLCKNQK